MGHKQFDDFWIKETVLAGVGYNYHLNPMLRECFMTHTFPKEFLQRYGYKWNFGENAQWFNRIAEFCTDKPALMDELTLSAMMVFLKQGIFSSEKHAGTTVQELALQYIIFKCMPKVRKSHDGTAKQKQLRTILYAHFPKSKMEEGTKDFQQTAMDHYRNYLSEISDHTLYVREFAEDGSPFFKKQRLSGGGSASTFVDKCLRL